MIPTTRLMLRTVADPEFFDRELYESLEGIARQLQTVWEMLHNLAEMEEAIGVGAIATAKMGFRI